MVITKAFRDGGNTLNFILENEMEKNYFQTFMSFIKTFRRNIMVFHYEYEKIPGYAIRYSPMETLNGFTNRLAETW